MGIRPLRKQVMSHAPTNGCQHLESATRPKITKMFLTMTITMTMTMMVMMTMMMMMMMVVVVVVMMMIINYYY